MATRLEDISEIRRPPYVLAAMEVVRAGVEGFSLMMAGGLLAGAARGDGHPVMFLPGFATDDASTTLLRHYIKSLGYEVHPWRLGPNLDHRTVGQNGERVAERIDALFAASGRKVSLVGWSLGGVIAREAARRDPGPVRQVITLSSPFCGNPRANHVGRLYERLSGSKVDSPAAMRRFAIGHHPLAVPSTAVYSKTDGITAWENCVSITDHQSENIEVHASHFGMVLNPTVFQIIADRLAQPEGEWAPFEPRGPLAFFYPHPAAQND